ncbi:MAG TPA: TonB-dependent receptor [Rhodanobacteraceae bacterium]|nr:TonB-dependent receptor [Rhodanobacteraceae bacterium]
MKPSLARLAGLGLALCAADVPAESAEAPESAGEGIEARRRREEHGPAPADALPTVQVTATRAAVAARDVPRAIDVVDASAARSAGALTLADLLRGRPGIAVQATTPGQATPIVRGLKGSEVLHVVDGFRLNNAIFRNAPNQYFALVDAQSLDRLEVVRGPGSTLYGSDAMGGVVQALTPEYRYTGTPWQAEGGARWQFASGDLSRLAHAEAAAGREGLSLAGSVTRQDVGTRRLGEGARLHPSAFDARAAQAKLLWSPHADAELVLSAQYLIQPSTPRVDELVPGYGQVQPTSAEFYFEPNRRRFLQVKYRLERTTAWYDRAEFQLGRQLIDDDRRTRDFGSSQRDLERNRDRLDGATASFQREAGAHRLAYGIDLYRDRVDSTRERLNLSSGVLTPRAARFPDGARMRSDGLWLSDALTLAPRWQLDAALRYDRVVTELPPNAQGVGVRLAPRDLSGSLALGFHARDDLRLVGSLARGFRAPNVFDLGVFGDRPGNRYAVPNADLRPETVVTADVGVKLDREGWRGEAFLWRSRYRDKITAVDTGEVTPSGRLVVQNRNLASLDLWGVEAGLSWRFGAGSEAYGVLNLTRGSERDGATHYAADRIPPLNGRMGLRWRPRTNLRLEGYAAYAARQDRLSPRDAIDPRINPAGTPGWSTLNASAAWDFRRDATLTLRLDNLADRRYREHGSGADEVGRSATVALDWRY